VSQVLKDVSILVEEEEKRDPDLDNTVAQLGIAEYQINKLRRILASRLDKSNPLAFSKRHSTYAFKFEDRVYRITIEADTFDLGSRSTTCSLRDAVKSPAFIIPFTLSLAIFCVLALVNLYWTSPVLGTLSDRELSMLEGQYSLILDRCAALMNDDRANPRSFGAQYSVCNKAIVQLQGVCKEHHIATCEDERIELYLTGNKARP
jgi:hypothetical protein